MVCNALIKKKTMVCNVEVLSMFFGPYSCSTVHCLLKILTPDNLLNKMGLQKIIWHFCSFFILYLLTIIYFSYFCDFIPYYLTGSGA